jgi:hypothetical protein
MHLELDVEGARLTLIDTEGHTRWQVPLDSSELERACFREAILWRAGGVACVGADDRVRFYDVETGGTKFEIALDALHDSPWSLFGHFGEARLRDGTELLIILTYTDVIALNASLELRWEARDVAIDGLTFHGACDDLLVIHAEMDPPGGWFEVALDARTGEEVSRNPSFTPGYTGIYAGSSEPKT